MTLCDCLKRRIRCECTRSNRMIATSIFSRMVDISTSSTLRSQGEGFDTILQARSWPFESDQRSAKTDAELVRQIALSADFHTEVQTASLEGQASHGRACGGEGALHSGRGAAVRESARAYTERSHRCARRVQRPISARRIRDRDRTSRRLGSSTHPGASHLPRLLLLPAQRHP